MSRTLAIFTVAGLALCGLFVGLAVVIGGENIFHDPHSLGGIKPLIDLASHKEWRWSGGDTLALDAPINVRYEPKGPQAVSVTGPADVLKHVQVADGRIATDPTMSRSRGLKVEAVVSGVAIRKFVVNGGQNLDLGQIDQPDLDLHLNGNGTVTGHGNVERLNLVIAGASRARLDGLSVGDARIAILGSGTASLSPHGQVQLFIAGSGQLNMLTKPASLRQTIVGSGDVRQLSEEAAKEALKAADVGRIASEAARDAIRAADRGLALPGVPAPAAPPMAAGTGFSDTVISKDRSRVAVRGNYDADLGHIDQPSLDASIFASGSVTAEGKVDKLSVAVFGSGQARFGRLSARRAEVAIRGSGDVTVAPSEALTVNIMGSGNVHLMTRPARIEQHIMGSGHVIPPP